jgi:poly-gamma-glutamate capsule biosynthesis protein CapA/YwtB (metallophosphatase superfamily)
MRQTMILAGDINLMSVNDPAVPFARVADALGKTDVVFGNLECCLSDPPLDHSIDQEGFYAGAQAGEALRLAGFHAVGCANNVTYGAEPIRASLARLDSLGIQHTGAGVNREAARTPTILEKGGVRFGFSQYTSVFWPIGHAAGERAPGVATIKAHTGYQAIVKDRAGVPPIVLTSADEEELGEFRKDIVSLRQRVDLLVSSHHWGFRQEVLQYQEQIAHAAVEAGVDIVMGHGVHRIMPIEIYRGKPIFYGLANFSFHTGHKSPTGPQRRVAGNWIGLIARITLDAGEIVKVTCSPVRRTERNETIIRSAREEEAAMSELAEGSQKYGTVLDLSGDEVGVWQKT